MAYNNKVMEDLIAKDAHVEDEIRLVAKILPMGVDALLGMVFTHLAKDKVVGELTVTEKTVQPSFVLHGGVNVVLAESLASMGTMFNLDKTRFTARGIEINAYVVFIIIIVVMHL